MTFAVSLELGSTTCQREKLAGPWRSGCQDRESPSGPGARLIPTEEQVNAHYAHEVSSSSKAIAVCMVGHVRTFVLPGVYSSLVSNVLRTAPTSDVDIFLVGHLGTYRGGDYSGMSNFFDSPETEKDPRLQKALKYLGSSIVHQEFSDGDCSALTAAWKRDGVQGRTCDKPRGANVMQIYWIDHCFRQVRSSGKPYDLILRTRPDIGVFAPVPWNYISWSHVNWHRISIQGPNGVDYFFTMPPGFIDTWWERVVNHYLKHASPCPDAHLFRQNQELLHEVNFSAAIVRGPNSHECWPFNLSPELVSECDAKARAGFFDTVIE